MRIAVFPGTFDPFTKGHKEIVDRALPLFDKVVVAIGSNASKSAMYDISRRKAWIESVYAGSGKVSVQEYQGLTAHFCKSIGSRHIIRGLRNTIDFEYEKSIAQANAMLLENLETVFFMCSPQWAMLSATIARDIVKNGGDISHLLPEQIIL
jgi:pantetheine-phosphate adenylyltransferase